jgi:hypothetical protein
MSKKHPKWVYKNTEAGLLPVEQDFERVLQIIGNYSNQGITFAVKFYEAVSSFKYDLAMEKQKPGGTEVRKAAQRLGEDTETLLNQLENILFSTNSYVYGALNEKVNPDSFIQKLKKDLSLIRWALSETESDHSYLPKGRGEESSRRYFAYRVAILFCDILDEIPIKYRNNETVQGKFAECIELGIKLASNYVPDGINRIANEAIDTLNTR